MVHPHNGVLTAIKWNWESLGILIIDWSLVYIVSENTERCQAWWQALQLLRRLRQVDCLSPGVGDRASTPWQDPISKIGGVVQVAEYLPSNVKASSSSPSTSKKQTNKIQIGEKSIGCYHMYKSGYVYLHRYAHTYVHQCTFVYK
jgi:hypothetical protein